MTEAAPGPRRAPLTALGVLAAVLLALIAGSAEASEHEATALERLDHGRALGWQVAAAVPRWLAYAGTLLAAGGAVFLAAVHDRRADERDGLARVLVVAALAGAVATLATIPLQGVLVSGQGASALVDGQVLADMAGSGVGHSALVRLVGLALLVVAVTRPWTRSGTLVGMLGTLLATGSLLLAGHTVTAEPRALALAATFAHVFAAAVWFGGLVLLAVVLRRRQAADDAVGGARMISRFSTLALLSVIVLVAAGGALSWVQVQAPRALTTTYGWTLITKVILVGALVVVAGYNNRRLVPAIRRRSRASAGAWRALSRTVQVEVVGIAAVLAVTAVLVNVVPAHIAAGIGQPISVYADLGPDHRLNLVIDPAEAGTNEIHLYLLEPAGRPADIAEDVVLRLRHPAAGEVELEPTVAGPGHYLHVGGELSLRGVWEVEAVVEDHAGDTFTATIEAPVGGRAR